MTAGNKDGVAGLGMGCVWADMECALFQFRSAGLG